MRARTVHLMTSWWVVVVWATLGVVTGVISVITVLQPAWYLRYSHIHAKPFQDHNVISFKVVVSSVGPLGFCRLKGVRKHVTDDSKIRSTYNRDFLTEPISVTEPVEIFSNADAKISKGSYSGDLHNENHQAFKITEATQDIISPSKTLEMSQQEQPPPPGAPDVYVSSSIFLGSFTSSFARPPKKFNEDSSGSNEVRISEGFPISANKSDKAGIREKSEDTEVVPPRETENHLNMAYEDQEEITDSNQFDSRNDSLTLKSENLVDTPDNSVSASFSRTAHSKGLTHIIETGTMLKEFPTYKYRNLSNYFIRKRKMRKRKRPRKHKNKKRNQKLEKKLKKRPNNVYLKTSSKTTGVQVTPLTETRDGSFIINKQNGSMSSFRSKGDPLAEFLIQMEPRTASETNDLAYYHPRTPILECSGITFSVGSGSSAVWVMVGVVYGVAGLVQIFAGAASIVTQAAPSPAARYAHAIWVGNVQVAVVMCQGVSLILFPLGLGSALARLECGGSSSVYWRGDCLFGWAYMLSIVATTLAAFCPCLARLTVYKRYAMREWESLNFF
ncbi:hypothetical protein SK128_007306 [Halocaridina rubra]|uniref:Uncharacterized protein n=1 Tax=Halocaridina rubra TaxID=373956 RepID=A0AAN8XMS5_HALRR